MRASARYFLLWDSRTTQHKQRMGNCSAPFCQTQTMKKKNLRGKQTSLNWISLFNFQVPCWQSNNLYYAGLLRAHAKPEIFVSSTFFILKCQLILFNYIVILLANMQQISVFLQMFHCTPVIPQELGWKQLHLQLPSSLVCRLASEGGSDRKHGRAEMSCSIKTQRLLHP